MAERPKEAVEPPTGAVFLSYASEDSEAATRIADALKAAGVEVWFDKSELRGGDVWDRQIRDQIHGCRLFVPIISASTEARPEGYFRREWKLAVDRTHDMSERMSFLVPVVVDGTPDVRADVPESFRSVQWTRLPRGETPAAFVARIVGLLGTKSPGALAHSLNPLATNVPPARTRRRRALWITVGLVAIAIGVGSGWFAWRRSASHQSVDAAAASQSQPAATERSIAVLPFVDLSEKHDQEYFADGIAEETLNQLAKVPGLKVIGRTSSFQFRGKGDDVRKIGATLGAAFVLEGSVRKSADRVRVTAQLVSTGDGSHRWSETYDEKLDDVLKMQDNIAASLARALEVTIGVGPNAGRGPTNAEAYDLYLRGLHALDSESMEGCEQAIDLLQRALDLEPNSTRTLTALAWAHNCIGYEGWQVPHAGFQQAREYANRVLSRDPKSVDAHVILANAYIVHDWDWTVAQREVDAALALGGQDSRSLMVAARLAAVFGNFDAADALLHQALTRDPLQPEAYDQLATNSLRTGRYNEAEKYFRQVLKIAPHFGGAHYWLAVSLALQNRLQEALAEADREEPGDGRFEARSMAMFSLGNRAESDTALTRSKELNSSDWPSGIARVYAVRGEPDEALRWLERAYEARDVDLFFIKGDPLFRNLEFDPRYRAFLRKMNLPE